MMIINTEELQEFDEGIWYIREYHPFNGGVGTQDDYDKAIMNLKSYDTSEEWKIRKQKEAERFFLKLLKEIVEPNSDTVVCYVPRSRVGEESHIGSVAKRLCEELDLIDGTDCLQRYRNINEAHTTGTHMAGRQLLSLRLNHPEIIQNARVLLLDDVITGGYSMRDCIRILSKAHPKEVLGLGMGFTTH